MKRDWTITDRAAAADDDAYRQWWKRPWPAGPDDVWADPDEGSTGNTSPLTTAVPQEPGSAQMSQQPRDEPPPSDHSLSDVGGEIVSQSQPSGETGPNSPSCPQAQHYDGGGEA